MLLEVVQGFARRGLGRGGNGICPYQKRVQNRFFLFQTLFYPFFWREPFELFLSGKQLIAVFQSDERRRALPLIRRQGWYS